MGMESNWAAEHLQTIRTLMERAALYRRALAPVMIYAGSLGSLAALAGVLVRIESPPLFIGYWVAVAVAAVAGAFLLVRRQALKDVEPFWSPPTRRVAQALLPAFFFGFVLAVTLVLRSGAGSPDRAVAGDLAVRWLPLLWIALYGCALHAAGFSMPRGMKVFGGALVLGSSAFCLSGLPGLTAGYLFGHSVMGAFFGVAHLAYGVYLYFTEPRGKET